MTPPRPSLGERVYRRLIRLLPPDFRGDFGESMSRDFRDQDRDATGRARRRLWRREWTALVRTGLTQWIDAAARDARLTCRMMARSPGFTAAAIVMLAVGTGANAAIFSVVDAVMLRSAYPDAGRIAAIVEISDGERQRSSLPYEHVAALAASPIFDGVAGASGGLPVLTGVGEARRLDVDCLSASAFRLIGVPPARGRVFGADDDRPDGPAVIVLSDHAWRREFGAAEDIVGRSMTLNNVANTVIGVMPPEFLGPFGRNRDDAWAPLAPAIGRRAASGCFARQSTVQVFARVRPPRTLTDAMIALNASGLAATLPPGRLPGARAFLLERADAAFYDSVRVPFLALSGAVGCVLLIACANVANLQLERLLGRRHELSLRLALGATPSRLVRQTLVENLILSGLGATAGLVAARSTLGAIVALIPLQVPHVGDIAVTSRTLVVTLGAALLCGGAVGLVPALQMSSLAGGLAASRRLVGGSSWWRRGLVIAEVALSMLLLVAAGLMLKTFLVLRPVHPGFASENRVVAQVLMAGTWHVDDARRQAIDAVLARVSATTGVSRASVTSYMPLSGETSLANITVGANAADVWTSWATPSYFADMEMTAVRGRLFADTDGAGAAPVAMVNDAFVERFFAAADPIGATIVVRSPDNVTVTRRIVGVVRTTRSWATDLERRSEVYVPYAQQPGSTLLYVVVHTQPGLWPRLPSQIRAAVSAAMPGQVVDRVESVQEMMSRSIARPRFAVWIFGSFAVGGALLAGLGLAAVIAWWVTERRREIGVRLALGARREHVISLVVGESLILAGVGTALGTAAAIATSHLLGAWMYGVATATDPAAYAAAAAGMLVITALSTWLPALRAARTDPISALRAE